jgi:uncharacterized membrane protein YjjP (DUF1212 family)
MENIRLIKSIGEPDLQNVSENLIIKDVSSGKLYMGNNNDFLEEIKTDKSSNWAKTFFYGGN